MGLLGGLVLTNVEFFACLVYQPCGAGVIVFKIFLKNKTNLLIFLKEDFHYLRTSMSFILINKVLNVKIKHLSFRNREKIKYPQLKYRVWNKNH